MTYILLVVISVLYHTYIHRRVTVNRSSLKQNPTDSQQPISRFTRTNHAHLDVLLKDSLQCLTHSQVKPESDSLSRQTPSQVRVTSRSGDNHAHSYVILTTRSDSFPGQYKTHSWARVIPKSNRSQIRFHIRFSFRSDSLLGKNGDRSILRLQSPQGLIRVRLTT